MTAVVYDFLLVGVGIVAIIVLSSIFIVPLIQSAYGGTFPGENGKIAFTSQRDGNDEIYVMNADGTNPTRLTNNPAYDIDPSWSPDGEKIAFSSTRDFGIGGNIDSNEIYIMNAADGSGQTRLTNNFRADFFPDWGPATELEEDTTPPVLTVQDDIVVEATSEEGAEVTYTVTAEDNVDGNATLQEDGSITQDNIGGDIDISCELPSGTTFPIGETTVECSVTDEAGNTGDASFTVTVNPPPTTPALAINELISDVENLDDNVPQSVKTSLTAPLKEASDILTDDNPNNDKAACGKLGAFINQVNANERRGTLTADQADELRGQAEDIMNQLDC